MRFISPNAGAPARVRITIPPCACPITSPSPLPFFTSATCAVSVNCSTVRSSDSARFSAYAAPSAPAPDAPNPHPIGTSAVLSTMTGSSVSISTTVCIAPSCTIEPFNFTVVWSIDSSTITAVSTPRSSTMPHPVEPMRRGSSLACISKKPVMCAGANALGLPMPVPFANEGIYDSPFASNISFNSSRSADAMKCFLPLMCKGLSTSLPIM